MEKRFTISSWEPEGQSVSVTEPLGRILLHGGVVQIIESYGSKIVKTPNFQAIDIVPPIPADKRDELGEALVDLAKNLDPSDPPPTYELKTIEGIG
jgi:hypothetical protein